MDVSRRDFLKVSGAATVGAATATLNFDLSPVKAYARPLAIRYAQETTTICPYCAVGCGIITHTHGGRLINSEGDPDHPINEGTLCSKGKNLDQLAHSNNPLRLTTPRYRASAGAAWQDISWDQALDKIARWVKDSRDESFVTTNAGGQVVNRCDGIASVGSAALDNEECYLLQKFLRGLGLVYIEHQARI